MNNNRNNGLFDAMAITSFLLGMANYNENVTQSTLQETAKNIISDIHNHLKEQDEKIDYIINMLEGGQNK